MGARRHPLPAPRARARAQGRDRPAEGRRGPRGRPAAARSHRAGLAGGLRARATPLRTRGASGSDCSATTVSGRRAEVHGAVGVDAEVRVEDEVPAEAVGVGHARAHPAPLPLLRGRDGGGTGSQRGGIQLLDLARGTSRCGRATGAAPPGPWATAPYSLGICATSHSASSCPGAHCTKAISSGRCEHEAEAEPVDVEVARGLDVAHPERDGGDGRSGGHVLTVGPAADSVGPSTHSRPSATGEGHQSAPLPRCGVPSRSGGCGQLPPPSRPRTSDSR